MSKKKPGSDDRRAYWRSMHKSQFKSRRQQSDFGRGPKSAVFDTSPSKADPLRETFETFGRRIAMHAEQRMWDMCHELVDQMKQMAGVADGLIGIVVGGGLPDIDLEMPMAELIDDVRICNMLERINVFRLADLLRCKRRKILAIPNVGRKSLEIIGRALGKLGFVVPGDFLDG